MCISLSHAHRRGRHSQISIPPMGEEHCFSVDTFPFLAEFQSLQQSLNHMMKTSMFRMSSGVPGRVRTTRKEHFSMYGTPQAFVLNEFHY